MADRAGDPHFQRVESKFGISAARNAELRRQNAEVRLPRGVAPTNDRRVRGELPQQNTTAKTDAKKANCILFLTSCFDLLSLFLFVPFVLFVGNPFFAHEGHEGHEEEGKEQEVTCRIAASCVAALRVVASRLYGIAGKSPALDSFADTLTQITWKPGNLIT
jgi:hypothetical protein